jgi:hypothetical protein
MKKILTRTLLVGLLASSISAFAKSAEEKTNDAATPTNVTYKDNCNQNTDAADIQDISMSGEEQKIEQQDKDWLHDLQGTYGG